MTHIITTTQVQQKIGHISDTIQTTAYIVTNRGEGRIVMLPYFDGCDEQIEEYMENYEMSLNKETLMKKWDASAKSGASDLVI